MFVAEIMTPKVFTVSPETSVEEADGLMKEHSIRHLPVVDLHAGLVGMVSDREVRQVLDPRSMDELSILQMEEVGTEQNSSENEKHLSSQLSGVTVGEIMTKNVLTVTPYIDVAVATSLIYFQKIGGLPVVDDQKKLVGILTAIDLLRLLATMLNTLGVSVHVGVILGEDPRAFTKISKIIEDNYGEVVSVWMTGAEYEKAERVYHFQLAACDTGPIIASIKKAGFTVVENGQESAGLSLSA